MCITDRSPTCYNLRPITLDEKPQNAPQARGAITQAEELALGAVKVAKVISEPIDKFEIASSVISFIASQARKRRSTT